MLSSSLFDLKTSSAVSVGFTAEVPHRARNAGIASQDRSQCHDEFNNVSITGDISYRRTQYELHSKISQKAETLTNYVGHPRKSL
jgi:hypothetical protein